MAAAHPTSSTLRVGTRASPLALWQTRHFISLLSPFCPILEECQIRTTGDAVQNQRLADIGGKGLFAKEIHEALLDRRVDFAVHSLKDLETVLPEGIVLACTLAREDARDGLILPPGHGPVDPANPYRALKQAAVVGTSSMRRQAQLLHARPDLTIVLLRGNVASRLAKLERGDCDATLLALAGLRRLGMAHAASVVLDPDIMVPSAGQGIVGITVRESDSDLRDVLAKIGDEAASRAATAERSLLGVLDGSCRTPIGGHARVQGDGRMHLTGLVARGDGGFLLKRSVAGAPEDAERLGKELGASLRADSPSDIFA